MAGCVWTARGAHRGGQRLLGGARSQHVGTALRWLVLAKTGCVIGLAVSVGLALQRITRRTPVLRGPVRRWPLMASPSGWPPRDADRARSVLAGHLITASSTSSAPLAQLSTCRRSPGIQRAASTAEVSSWSQHHASTRRREQHVPVPGSSVSAPGRRIVQAGRCPGSPLGRLLGRRYAAPHSSVPGAGGASTPATRPAGSADPRPPRGRRPAYSGGAGRPCPCGRPPLHGPAPR